MTFERGVRFAFFAVVMPVFGMCGCTESPFSEEETSLGSRQVRGSVTLNDGASPEGVYVWLEGVDLGVYTDASGGFKITLPPPSTQAVTSGIFKLYFFVANYNVASAETFLQNGEFVYDKGDINKNGELKAAIRLEKFLHVTTEVQPATFTTAFKDTIRIIVTMRASGETVTVKFPYTCSERNCPDPNYRIGAVLLRKIGTSDVLVVQMVPGATSQHMVTVGLASVTRRMFFRLDSVSLSPGVYEAIPYLLIEGKTLPPGLLDSIGDKVLDLGVDYLKLPFQREDGRFEVTR